jgi:NAD(P)-dependent dehydrogenase (short-subunit alcohol dehydrogenase family)
MATMNLRNPLENRVAIVTGGHDGIGYYISEALVARGMRVAIFARRRDVLERTANKLGDNVRGFVCDIRHPDQVRSAFGEVDAAFGRLDALVNNAALFNLYKVADATDEELRATLETNLLGVLHCVREAVPRLRGQGGGNIVNVSTESVNHPFPFLSVYAATKAAVETLSRALRNELRPFGIRVGVLRSGHVAVPDRAAGSSWDPARARAFYAEAEAGGHLAMSGPGIDPRTTAAAVVSMLEQPSNAAIDLLELRGS